MRIDVYQQHGKDHSKKTGGPNGCGCMGEPGTSYDIEVPCLPPVGSNICVQGRKGAWRELTVERYTFGAPNDPGRVRCWASYDTED